MKKLLVTAIFVLGLVTIPAHATLKCTALDESAQLTIRPLAGKVFQAEVLLTKDGKESVYGAKIVPSPKGPLFEKTDYQLQTCEPTESTLSVVSRVFIGRGGCGRAGCPPTNRINAKLNHQESQTEFKCDEVLE